MTSVDSFESRRVEAAPGEVVEGLVPDGLWHRDRSAAFPARGVTGQPAFLVGTFESATSAVSSGHPGHDHQAHVCTSPGEPSGPVLLLCQRLDQREV
jgi:hypothetical protein